MFKKDKDRTDREIKNANIRDVVALTIFCVLCLADVAYIGWQYFTSFSY